MKKVLRVGIIALVCVAFFSVFLFFHRRQQRSEQEARHAHAVFDEHVRMIRFRVRERINYLYSTAAMITDNDVLAQYLYAWSMSGNKTALADTVHAQYQVLGLSQFRVMDTTGRVIYRAHSSLRRDDHVDDAAAIAQVVVEDETVFTITDGVAPQTITCAILVPIRYFEQCVGYCALGIVIDDAFFSPDHRGVCVHGLQYRDGDETYTFVTERDQFLKQYLREGTQGAVARTTPFQYRLQRYITGAFSVDHPSVDGSFIVYGFNHAREEHKENVL